MNYDLSKIRIKCAELVGYDKQYIYEGALWHIKYPHPTDETDCVEVPAFTESADAALELVAWMAKPENGGFGFSANRLQKDGRWEVFFEHASWDAHFAQADTFQLAVCLAFLKANNINPETL